MNKIISIIAIIFGVIGVIIGAVSFAKVSAVHSDLRTFRAEQLYSQGLVSLNQRDFDAAEERFMESLAYNPKMKNANFQLAFISVAKNEKNSALVLVEKELENYPDNAQALALIGTLQIMDNNFAAAEENLAKAIMIQPGNRDAVQNLSHLYREREQSSNAIEVLEKYLALRPDDGLMQFKYQMSLIAGGRVSRMVTSLQERINAGTATGADYVLATAIQLGNNDVKQAYAALNEALKRAPAQDIQGLLQDPFFKDYTEVINNFAAYKKKAQEKAQSQEPRTTK
jgi:predicted Zn-dependent protease